MAREAFPRTPSGLVDLTCYIPYLPDPPEEVPLSLPPSFNELELGWKRHHLIFKGDVWREEGVALQDKEYPERALFRSHEYNQLIMRPWEELKVHERYQEHIEPESIPETAITGNLRDFNSIDSLVVASFGRHVAMQPSTFTDLIVRSGRPRAWDQLSATEIIEFFEGSMEGALDQLDSTIITDHQVIASALKRASMVTKDPMLTSIADQRLVENPYVYPLKVRKVATLYSLGCAMLAKNFGTGRSKKVEQLLLERVAA